MSQIRIQLFSVQFNQFKIVSKYFFILFLGSIVWFVPEATQEQTKKKIRPICALLSEQGTEFIFLDKKPITSARDPGKNDNFVLY